jgi:type IV pilus assembly protein PilW
MTGNRKHAGRTSPRGGKRSPRQRGVTLVELLVALVLGTLIALAAMASLSVARRGFATVDVASQLRDNSRLAADLIQRIANQGGFLDIPYAVNTRSGDAGAGPLPPPPVFGFDNAVMTIDTPPLPADPLNGNRTAASAGCAVPADTACVNGADILVLRYHTPATMAGGTVGDRSTINCAGITQELASTSREDLVVSAFHVALSRGEPSLMCSHQDASGAWQTAAQPVIQGVESFQVLYGVDGVTPGNPTAGAADTVAERYLRAEQIVVPGNPVATDNNWRRVRSIRIGMVLRGPPGSAQERGGANDHFFPLGAGMSSPADVGARFTPPSDGRLRQTVTFTAYLRNHTGL